jgi:hypothetical protein
MRVENWIRRLPERKDDEARQAARAQGFHRAFRVNNEVGGSDPTATPVNPRFEIVGTQIDDRSPFSIHGVHVHCDKLNTGTKMGRLGLLWGLGTGWHECTGSGKSNRRRDYPRTQIPTLLTKPVGCDQGGSNVQATSGYGRRATKHRDRAGGDNRDNNDDSKSRPQRSIVNARFVTARLVMTDAREPRPAP